MGEKPPLKPLRPLSFAAEIPGINAEQSQAIWEILKTHQFIIVDAENPAYPCAKQTGLDKLLTGDFYPKSPSLRQAIKNLLFDAIQKKCPIRYDIFEKYLGIEFKDPIKKDAWNYFKKFLNQRGDVQVGFLSTDFCRILAKYSAHFLSIAAVLYRHANTELGQSEYDLEVYEIDGNGNYCHYYKGSSRYNLMYKENTNQIRTLNFSSPRKLNTKYDFQHDFRGNVVKAEHLGISKIEYNPIINKASKIELANKTSLEFYYDAAGKRALKRVRDAKGQCVKEIYYFRDEIGRVLKEKVWQYQDELKTCVGTDYLYGPRGLIGFIRENHFYAILTDHLGSTRLVIDNGEVVAAYDYDPYGDFVRCFSKLTIPLRYLYTGQEWDEEIELYNFPARLYDPKIGRFYQIDPQNQYFSPYKYAGNTPTVMADPDGEFAQLIISGVLAVGGAYLGGAAANGTWNPLKWDYSSGSTWYGMGAGALAGAFIPIVGPAAVGVLTTLGCSTGVAIGITTALGVGGAYVAGAASQGSWNPTTWNYQNPQLYASALQGALSGITLPMGFGSVGAAIGTLAAGSFLAGFNMAAANNSLDPREWDWTSPATYNGALQGFSAGAGIFRGPRQLAPSNLVDSSLMNSSKIVATIGFGYLGGVASNRGECDPRKWNWQDPRVWQSITMGGAAGMSIGKSVSTSAKVPLNAKVPFITIPSNLKAPKQGVSSVVSSATPSSNLTVSNPTSTQTALPNTSTYNDNEKDPLEETPSDSKAPEISSSPGPGISDYEEINPEKINCSQDYISATTSEGMPIEELVENMKRSGWGKDKDPIDVVRMPNGVLVTIDNRRVYAAHQAGIQVRARIHQASAPLPDNQSNRFVYKYNVRVEKVKSKGKNKHIYDKFISRTWGEAIEHRILHQNSYVMRACYPHGIPVDELVILPPRKDGQPDIEKWNYDFPEDLEELPKPPSTTPVPETQCTAPSNPSSQTNSVVSSLRAISLVCTQNKGKIGKKSDPLAELRRYNYENGK